ncbi:LOW QUALITY PROTEIN: probable G-protein coupled receptor 32 [Nannospalax galili]|uniref:LOW QUALITY PROTEIN: probable G-protein coupled receptor 32 n=1 Tax=Nannospalax galili TaxID=1026970 RepID=UPI0004ED2CAD|nr:LOW QUALITY PROTEIN: probable G-protein coupled receptor 32 [Nannospalax galili]
MADPECQLERVGCLRHLTMAILSVSCVVGVLGNGLVLWMTLFRMTSTVTTVWFFNLALADFLVLLSLPVSIYIVANGWWPSAGLVCRLYMAFLILNFFASIYLLVLISVDRCILVLYPVWARNHRTVRRATWLAIVVWLLAAAACSPSLKYRTVDNIKGCEQCFFNFSSHKKPPLDWSLVDTNQQMALAVAHFLLGFLVPLSIISTCAYLIRAKLRREGWVHASRPKTLLVVLVSAFFIFWFPFNLGLLVESKLLPSWGHSYLSILWVTFSLGCFNSCLNPFLYVFIGRDFQQRFFQSASSALARAFGEEGFISSCPGGKSPRRW